MSEKIVQLNEEVIKGQIKELVRGSVEETLNELLEKEVESLTQAARYERSEARQGYRSGHYDRNLTTTSGDVTLHMPRLKGVSFETAIIERYRRRESSVEKALIFTSPLLGYSLFLQKMRCRRQWRISVKTRSSSRLLHKAEHGAAPFQRLHRILYNYFVMRLSHHTAFFWWKLLPLSFMVREAIVSLRPLILNA